MSNNFIPRDFKLGLVIQTLCNLNSIDKPIWRYNMSTLRSMASNYTWNCSSQFQPKIQDYLKHLNSPKTKPIIEKGGYKIAEKFGYSRDDFTDDDVRSYYDPEKLYDQLLNFGSEIKTSYDKGTMIRAVRQAVKQLGITKGSLRPLALDKDLSSHLKLEKNSGLPMLTSKGNAFYDSLYRAQSILELDKGFTPAIATYRTQRKRKTRLAWSMPLDQILVEHTIYQPIIDGLSISHPLLTKHSTSVLGSKLYSKDIEYKYNVGIDYSQFDSSVPSSLIYSIFGELEKLFGYGDDLEKDYLSRLFAKIANGFIHTNIMMPDGKLYQKHRGIPSGSQLTSIIGSLANLSMLRYYAIVKNIKMESFVLGDDSATFTNSKIYLEDVSKFMFSTFGMKVSVEKSSIRTKDVEVLGYVWVRGLRTEDVRKTLAKLIFPETSRKSVTHYSKFLSNLVLEYALTNKLMRNGLAQALRVQHLTLDAFSPRGDETDSLDSARKNRLVRYVHTISRAEHNVIAHALS